MWFLEVKFAKKKYISFSLGASENATNFNCLSYHVAFKKNHYSFFMFYSFFFNFKKYNRQLLKPVKK